MKYSSQTETDMAVLFSCLENCMIDVKRVRVCEIGIFDGCTARAIKERCDQNCKPLDYWGVDNSTHPNFKMDMKLTPPFAETKLIIGDSAEVFHFVPDNLDLVLIDGCHCFNHVVLDTLHYSPKVRIGGFLLFHDTSPEIQHTMKDPHGPDIPEFYNSVVDALLAIKFPWRGWTYFDSDYEKGAKIGGITAYQKTAQ